MTTPSGHVAIITSNYWPEPTGISQTSTEFAEYLAGCGLDVRVATAMPYYPAWQIAAEYRGRLFLSERRNGTTIRRSWHFVRARPTTLIRIVHELTLVLFALPNVFWVLWGAQRVYVISPDLGFATVASVIAWLLRVPRTLVVKDVMPDAAVELGMMSNPVLIGVSRSLAWTAYRLANEIQTLAEGMGRRIARWTSERTPVRIVPDTIDVKELAPAYGPGNEFRRKFVDGDVFVVLHTGNMGRKQDLDLLLRAAQALQEHPNIQFMVFGDGAVKDDFILKRDRMELANVRHFPLQPRPMLRHMLSGADVVLVSQLAEVVDIVVPSKLLTAFAAGAMVVAACAPISETARLVSETGGGIVVPAGDHETLAETILRLSRGEIVDAYFRRAAISAAADRFERDAVLGPIAESLGGRVGGIRQGFRM